MSGAAPIRDTDHLFSFNGFDPKITAALLAQQHAHEQSLAATNGVGSGSGSGSSADGRKGVGKHVFETSEMWKVPETEPIYDIGITFSSKESALPPGWELLKKSMTGSPADLNKGSGAKPAYLTFRRGPPPDATAKPDAKQSGSAKPAATSSTDKTPTSANSTASVSANGTNSPTSNSTASVTASAAAAAAPQQSDGLQGEALKPITSLSVIFADTQEEAPYGFKRISHTADKIDANLGAAGRSVFLCVFRGDGGRCSRLHLHRNRSIISRDS